MPSYITYQQFYSWSGALPDFCNELIATGKIKVTYKNNVMMIDEDSAVSFCSTLPSATWQNRGGNSVPFNPCPKGVASGYPRR